MRIAGVVWKSQENRVLRVIRVKDSRVTEKF